MLGKKGIAQNILYVLFGLLLATQFMVSLLPDIISNLSDSTIFTGTTGRIITTTLPLLVVAGIVFMIMKFTGFSGKGGK